MLCIHSAIQFFQEFSLYFFVLLSVLVLTGGKGREREEAPHLCCIYLTKVVFTVNGEDPPFSATCSIFLLLLSTGMVMCSVSALKKKSRGEQSMLSLARGRFYWFF